MTTPDAAIATPEAVLAFWFDEMTPADWFRKSDALDATIRQRFAATHLSLARSIGDEWRSTPEAWLTLIVVLDQFGRNIYRDTPLAFATDGLALKEARAALDAKADIAVPANRRLFFYLPFEHSERMEDQDRSVSLFEALGNDELTGYAVRHREVIDRYGRFPHRNRLIGRTSTPDEEAYLAEPGAGF